jgi:uncharacterized membrane protein YozB (DUF420 family)
MTKYTNYQPASLLDIARFLTSPWVMLTIVVSIVYLGIVARVEAIALQTMTAPWFVPYGAVFAAVGLLASVFFIRRGPHAAMRLAGLAALAFAPAFLFMFVQGEVEPLTASAKAMLGGLFTVAPWIVLFGALMDRRTARIQSAA